MRAILRELGFGQIGSTRVYEDNNGCMEQSTATKGMNEARNYLVTVALAKLNESVQVSHIHLYRVDSDSNRADQMTKFLGGPVHTKLGTMNMETDMSFLGRNLHKAKDTPMQVVEHEFRVKEEIPSAVAAAMIEHGGKAVGNEELDPGTKLKTNLALLSRDECLNITLKHAERKGNVFQNRKTP